MPQSQSCSFMPGKQKFAAKSKTRPMPEENLYRDPLLSRFYDLENAWSQDFDFCRALAENRRSILDLGCGTGMFAAEMARDGTCDVVGVDPASAMLDIARKRRGGRRATWIEGDARTLELGRRFELIVLTGHVFQVFLTKEDRAAILRTIAQHLSPDGRFIFDSRNPKMEEWKTWTPEDSRKRFTHPDLGEIIAWHDVSPMDGAGVVAYRSFFKVAAEGMTYCAAARICFPSRESIAEQIRDAGLAVDRWFGDWHGTPWTETSKEIIALGRLA